jgi:hypothetical protein
MTSIITSLLGDLMSQKNYFNNGSRANNVSGYRGVAWDKSRSKWTVNITINKKTYHIGRFDNKEDAIYAHKKFAKEHGIDFDKPKTNMKEWRKQYNEEHKEEIAAKRKEYDRIRASRNSKVRKQKRWERKLLIIKEYGGKCECCGENHPEFLAVDHINGGGRKHVKSLNTHFYLWLIQNNFPKDNFRLLCNNCNQARGHYGYCPHEKENEK